MIVGKELEAWIGDRARQDATRQTIESFRTDWPRQPVHQLFGAAMSALRDPDAADVVATIRSLFADDAWVDVLVASLAAALRDESYFLPPFPTIKSAVHSGLLVYEDAHVQIAAGVSQAMQFAAKKNGKSSGGSVNFNGQITVLKLVRAGGATFSFWEAPPITDEFSASSAGRCRRAAERAVRDGEILVIDGRSQSYVIEHAATNLLVLQAAIRTDQAPLSVEYDAISGVYLGCSATDDADSRVQMIATLLRKLGGGEAAFAAIAAYLDHPRFFVRWHAMRELLGIDARAAQPRLAVMAARDPHPEVRAAARAALDRLPATAAAREAA